MVGDFLPRHLVCAGNRAVLQNRTPAHLSALAQKVTTETSEPVKESFTKAFKKVG